MDKNEILIQRYSREMSHIKEQLEAKEKCLMEYQHAAQWKAHRDVESLIKEKERLAKCLLEQLDTFKKLKILSKSETILPDSDSVNRVAAISFSSDDYTGKDISTDWVDYNGKSGFNQKIEGLGTKGGTNWQLAMRNADKKLEPRAESENKKVVVFLSDGEPTYRYEKSYRYPYEEYEAGGGQSYSSANLTNAVNEVAGSGYLKDAEIYSVYLTSQTSTRMTEFANKLTAKNINAHAKDGTNMASALQEIINQIVAPAYQNVVIEDTLSEYVQFHDLTRKGIR